MLLMLLSILLGLLLLFFGGEWLVRSSVLLAERFKVSPFIISVTIIAYGTSSPELLISIQAALAGHPDIALGNVIGSNIGNILCVGGLSAMIYPIAKNTSISLEDSILFFISAFLLVVIASFFVFSIWVGALFIGILCLYTYRLFSKNSSQNQEDALDEVKGVEDEIPAWVKRLGVWAEVGIVIISILLLTVGSHVLVDGASGIAKILGFSEAVIAVTIVAFGGSSPELAAAVSAARRGKTDMILGNIIGSNLFNILGVLGSVTFLSSLPVTEQFIQVDLPVLLLASLAIVLLMRFRPAITRVHGGFFFLSYLGYIAWQFTQLT